MRSGRSITGRKVACNAGRTSANPESADSSAAGNAGVTPRRMSCSSLKMAHSYEASTSETPAASALR